VSLDCGLDSLESNLSRSKRLFLLQNIHSCSGVHSASSVTGSGGIFLSGKLLGCEADHLALCSASVRMIGAVVLVLYMPP
jgi:hypothetical protein